jgi:hypothetical protein
LENISEWLACPDRGEDVELEPQSLIAKLRKGPLVPQVQESGWLGVVFPFPPKEEILNNISVIHIAAIDGGEEIHEYTFNAPFPIKDERLVIVAKHVRSPHDF